MKEEWPDLQDAAVYRLQDEMMACAVRHRQELSKTCCINGHCVCSECHTKGPAGSHRAG